MATTVCSNTQESIDRYKDYVNTHIRNVKVAYNKYADTLKDVLGINKKELLERVLNHDKSKWSKEEFDGYRKKFYPTTEESTENQDPAFEDAWFHHLKNNDHHPEYWTYVDDKETNKIKDMPNICIAEMILDWATFSILKEDDKEFIEFWEKNKFTKPFSTYTRNRVEEVMDKIKEGNNLWQ